MLPAKFSSARWPSSHHHTHVRTRASALALTIRPLLGASARCDRGWLWTLASNRKKSGRLFPLHRREFRAPDIVFHSQKAHRSRRSQPSFSRRGCVELEKLVVPEHSEGTNSPHYTRSLWLEEGNLGHPMRTMAPLHLQQSAWKQVSESVLGAGCEDFHPVITMFCQTLIMPLNIIEQHAIFAIP